ncbi:MAG: hypothetical protein N2544_01245 [Burkholderiales bacterium]|nr:hypothetical protein [Burkholderiales bacterium]
MTKAELAAAVVLLEAGDWRSAHAIVQRDEHDPLACWAHGIVHLLEGDPANAGYWYARARRPLAADPDAAAELAALRRAAAG